MRNKNLYSKNGKLLKFLSVIALMLFCAQTFAQVAIKPAQLVANQSGKFESVSLYTQSSSSKRAQTDMKLKESVLLDLNFTALKALTENPKKALHMTLPTASQGNLELDMVRVDLFRSNFVITEQPSGIVHTDLPGVHYRGTVSGDPNSLVAMSFFDGEISGFVSTQSIGGNFILGKIKGDKSATHVVYNDDKFKDRVKQQCHMEEEGRPYTQEELSSDRAADVSDCIGLFYEVDYNIYTAYGSNYNTTVSYLTVLANAVGTMYANENINTRFSEAIVWTGASPYTGPDVVDYRNQFQALRNNFNGDFANLLTYNNIGGIAANINTVCAAEDLRMCITGVVLDVGNLPAYTQDVLFATHEFGHLFGSFHTHRCVWNGNGTQIDDCGNAVAEFLGDTPEGNACFDTNNGIYPIGTQGTVMSYCHSVANVGTNLANGFGVQPGNVIRNVIANAPCASACPGCTNELANNYDPDAGVDDGSCIFNCPNPDIRFQITTDCAPQETSWVLQDEFGNTLVDSQFFTAANTYHEYNFCLEPGCYEMIISDTNGNGLDGTSLGCNSGNVFLSTEDYSFAFMNSFLAIPNSNFGSTLSIPFCVGASPGCNDPTANNYVQNHPGNFAACTYDCNPAAGNVTLAFTMAPSNPWYSSWILREVSNGMIVEEMPLFHLSASTFYQNSFCLPPGDYLLELSGFSGGDGTGNANLLIDGALFSQLTFNQGIGNYTIPFSLNVFGCTAPLASNYNPDANIDDGSCDYNCPNANTFLGITADCLPAETYYYIQDDEGNIVFEDIPEPTPNSNKTYNFCLPPGCYSLVVQDSGGDGLSNANGCNTGNVFLTGTDVQSGALIGYMNSFLAYPGNDFGSELVVDFCVETPGCSDPTATNFTHASPVPIGPCTYDCGINDSNAQLNLQMGNDFPWYINWQLINLSDGNAVEEAVPLFQLGTNQTYNYSFCLEPGEYALDLDGLFNDANGLGSFNLFVEGVNVPVTILGGLQDYYATFTINQFGCNQAEASNYDPAATADDGSCIFDCPDASVFIDIIPDCYPEDISWSIQSEEGTVVLSQTANQLNNALCLPAGCYFLDVNDAYGDGLSDISCGPVDAPNITITDANGTILYDFILDGSFNYGFGTIIPFCIEAGCPADVDGNGEIGVSDLLAVVGALGCVESCAIDIDGNGNTDIADLLGISSLLGTLCD